MDEDEERMTGLRIEPLAGRSEYGLGRPFHLRRLLSRIRTEMKWAVVDIESLIQTEAGVQHISADESRRTVPTGLKHFRQGDDAAWNFLTVFFNAMDKRICGTQHGCMGGEGEGNQTVYLAEQGSFSSERVEMRSTYFAVPVAAKVICAQGIYGYQNYGRCLTGC